jgi:uncharacterized protein YbjT (DUF2867 family)
MSRIETYEYFCTEMPTDPCPQKGIILITGATGYIGGRLVPELHLRGYRTRILVRAWHHELNIQFPGSEVIVGDVLDRDSLIPALENVYAAYYLVHSFKLGEHKFETADYRAAVNFSEVAEEMGVSRLIYLGGLGDSQAGLSPHLKSRYDVANVFRQSKVPSTILRAAIIIGSGSASYEIIHSLVKNLPFMFMPPWARTRCQPISVRDVIKYLVGVMEEDLTTGKEFDIGGADVLSYEEMLETQAEITGKKILFIPFPLHVKRIYSYSVSLLTPVPRNITRLLMGSVMNDVVILNNDINNFLPFVTISYKESLIRALSLEEKDNIRTRWSDAYPPEFELAIKLDEMSGNADFTSEYFLDSQKQASELFHTICKIGGKEGWFHYNWMWRMRGYIDRILLGVGSSRGRKNKEKLAINDVVDFWRVEDIRQNHFLVLRAEMKIPGKAWLRFGIDQKHDRNVLSVKALFYTKTVWGKIYWYLFLPFHFILFKALIKQIDLRS